MSDPLLRVCVTGPESTGKTTLARRLAERFHTEWVPEGSRVYAERIGRALTAADVTPIGREHVMLADAAAELARAAGASLLVLDTDLLSTEVYSRYYYGAMPHWMEGAERERRADLYLLCDVDVPWIPDGVRDQPTDRHAMFLRFQQALARRSACVTIVRGDWDERWAIACAAVSMLAAGLTPAE